MSFPQIDRCIFAIVMLRSWKSRPRKHDLSPLVDALLSTAAGAYRDRLIAVILTGFGSDGAAGAVDVKNAGGTVIVQNPQTARYPSMPLALPPTVIDFEADIERIGPAQRLAHGRKPTAPRRTGGGCPADHPRTGQSADGH